MPFLTVNEAKVYYEIDGSGPPLLLAMGLGGNSQVWAPIRRQMASKYQLVMYDMLGTGRSDKAENPHSRESLLHEVDAVLDHLKLERVLALGYSFGTSVMLNYAARSPERIAAIALVAGVYNVTPHARAFFDVQTELALKLTRGEYLKQAFLWLCSEGFFDRNAEFFERMLVFLERSRKNEEPFAGWKSFITAFDSDYRPTLKTVAAKVPVRIVHGSADKVSSIDKVRETAAMAEKVELEVVQGGGHMLPWDAPEPTVAALLGFFEKHDQSFKKV